MATMDLSSMPISRSITTRKILCFRECAKLVTIAEETGSVIKLRLGNNVGSTQSLLSLTKLGISADSTVTLTIEGGDTHSAYNQAVYLFEHGVDG